MSAQPKFDPEAYKQASEGYLEYLKASWEMSVTLAEDCIKAPRDLDDLEATDQRREIVYHLALVFLNKMTIDARDGLWQGREGK